MLGGDAHDNQIPKPTVRERIDQLHLRLKEDYTVRWELDAHLLAIHYNRANPPEWMVLDISDTFHYYNLPDLIPLIRSTLMGLCCSQWLQRLFNIFLCGKRYRRMMQTTDSSCQLTSAVINTLHGLLLGLYPFNERRMDLDTRAWVAGSIHTVITSARMDIFISEHPSILCMSLAEYILNTVHDFCPVEWALLGVTASSKSQCLAILEGFRESSISIAAARRDDRFWARIESDAQPVVATMIKFFRDASLYQHRSKGVIPVAMTQHLPLALSSRMIQNSSSIFGQLKCTHPGITFKESEALEEIWTSIYTRSLPSHSALKQMRSLERLGGMCHMMEKELHHLPLCIACAITRRADALKTLFRFDALNERLVCNECLKHESVVHINLLGRIMYVRDKAISLCEQCLRPKYWDTPCACLVDEPTRHDTCCVCTSTNTISSKDIVDVEHRLMRKVRFCYKHSLSCVLNSATVYDMRALEQEVRNRAFKPAVS